MQPEIAFVTPTPQGSVAWFYATHLGDLPAPEDARAYLLEEVKELTHALAVEGPEAQLKELADVLYTAYGYALARGWNLTRAFEIVHESNMSKPASVDGKKVVKGEGYVAPDLGSCIGGAS